MGVGFHGYMVTKYFIGGDRYKDRPSGQTQSYLSLASSRVVISKIDDVYTQSGHVGICTIFEVYPSRDQWLSAVLVGVASEFPPDPV